MYIGNNLKKLRKNLNLTQQQMAEKLSNMSIHTYRKYEQNLREPRIDMLQVMAEALKIQMSDLIGFGSISETYINDDGEIVHIIPNNKGEISENMALQSLATYISYISNDEDYEIGNGKEYKELIDIVEEIVRGKVLLLKQDRQNKIEETGQKKRDTKMRNFLANMEELAKNDIRNGKEPEESVIVLLKDYYSYYPEQQIPDELNKYIE